MVSACAEVAHAVAEGAIPAEFQPQHDVHVRFDPAGHPVCPFIHGQVLGESQALRPELVAEQARDIRPQDPVAAEAVTPDRREAAGTSEPDMTS
ncbi:hypothetical protein [Streptomyces cyaneofuscatus]|uniref:hypothetical protein n=1 Tax=Streptomyces cyaneofuscatus TaxID=66883 RepID=UPI00342546A1